VLTFDHVGGPADTTKRRLPWKEVSSRPVPAMSPSQSTDSALPDSINGDLPTSLPAYDPTVPVASSSVPIVAAVLEVPYFSMNSGIPLSGFGA